MAIEVKVPSLPESVTDATVVTWHKKVGDTVSRDENLVDLETDKVVLEVPAPADGILTEIVFQVGSIVNSGQVLAKMGEEKESSPQKETLTSLPEENNKSAKENESTKVSEDKSVDEDKSTSPVV